MKILEYLFLIGICFSIFEFIWGVFKVLFNLVTSTIESNAKSNIVRIIKYILFISVTIHFVQTINVDHSLISSNIASIVLSTIVLGLYLLGKYQNRLTFAQFQGITNQFTRGISSHFDARLEKTLIIGGLVLYVLGSFFPEFFNNGISQWFTSSILDIYNAFFFGFIFKIIALFVLISTFSRGARIIGKLINGESFSQATESSRNIFQSFNTSNFNGTRFNQKVENEPEFTDYEDVTDDEIEEK